MSVYPQTQAYGQSFPPPTGYPQHVPQPPNYFAPHVPPPLYHVDPSTFRRDYSSRLNELTVNSRPLIQDLVMLAQSQSRYAEVVAQCIESHIRRVPPWMKLPAFYLLDAISKNVFDPYARQFTPLVVRLFIDTYNQVDQSIRSKMEEMLLTWRTGAPTQRELFGVAPQVAIERQIWGGETTQSNVSRLVSGLLQSPHVQNFLTQSSLHRPTISTAQVLSELEFVLGQKERSLQSNPYDKTTQTHSAVLQQLRRVVQNGVSQDELAQILNQLRQMAPPPPPPIPPQTMVPPPQPHLSQPSYAPPPPQPTFVPPPVQYAQPNYPPPRPEPSLPAPQPLQAAPAPVPTPPIAVPGNISSLFNSLVKAGIVSASGTPTGASTTAKVATPEPAETIKDAAEEYRTMILSSNIKLTSSEIVKQRPPIIKFLYEHLSLRCNQCGIRFPDGSEGKKKLESHLDMHFKQNIRAGQAGGRGHHRGWYITVEDWVSDVSVDLKGKGREDGSRSMNTKAAAAAEAAKLDAELRAMTVVVPPGDEAKAISCPICKEPLKSEFLEDEEEWVWRNAVLKDDKIYHATCHAEAIASKSTLVARLRGDGSSRSRSRTPEIKNSPPKASILGTQKLRKSESPSPSSSLSPRLLGTKRKAEDDGDSTPTSQSRQVTPPTKKVAL